jgi:ankyrin repeat protein
MIAEGFDASMVAVKDALHETVSGPDEYAALELLPVLLTNGFNVNYQRKPDYWSPLHVACANLRGNLVVNLLSCGADVNCVAKVCLCVRYIVQFARVGLSGR